MKKFNLVLTFLTLVGFSTVICFAIFATTQQNFRANANDPQVEVSAAVVDAINQGAPAESIIEQGGKVDIDKSLSMFMMVFDKDGKVTASSGVIGDNSPTPPAGAIEAAKKSGETRITWQPKPGVRIAAILKKVSDDKGVILVGRSLKEVESRIQQAFKLVAIAWGGLVVLSGLLAYLLSKNIGSASIAIVEENIILSDKEKK